MSKQPQITATDRLTSAEVAARPGQPRGVGHRQGGRTWDDLLRDDPREFTKRVVRLAKGKKLNELCSELTA